LIKNLVAKEQETQDLKKEIEELEENIHKIQDEYYKEKENAVKFEEKLRNRITEEESRKLITENNHFKIQNL
jgi:flagellar motility protein MotE (MotC chaperone)